MKKLLISMAALCSLVNGADFQPGVANSYSLHYVKSDRKWRFGIRSEPFDKLSSYLEDQVAGDLNLKGFRRLPVPQNGANDITLELLEVTIHPAYIKKPGMDVTVMATVRDSTGHLVFSKGYRGESRTVMNTYGHLIDHAIEDIARELADDNEFITTLATHRPTN